MIARFFKRAAKTTPAKKKAPVKKAVSKATPSAAGKKKETASKRVLTAEGWKRMMMRTYGSSKKVKNSQN